MTQLYIYKFFRFKYFITLLKTANFTFFPVPYDPSYISFNEECWKILHSMNWQSYCLSRSSYQYFFTLKFSVSVTNENLFFFLFFFFLRKPDCQNSISSTSFIPSNNSQIMSFFLTSS